MSDFKGNQVNYIARLSSAGQQKVSVRSLAGGETLGQKSGSSAMEHRLQLIRLPLVLIDHVLATCDAADATPKQCSDGAGVVPDATDGRAPAPLATRRMQREEQLPRLMSPTTTCRVTRPCRVLFAQTWYWSRFPWGRCADPD